VRRNVQAVSISNAFYQFLPPTNLKFLKRSYFVRVPRPLIPAITAAPIFPRILPLMRIAVPQQQVLVIQDVVFTAYRNTNIDPLDYVALSPLENKRLFGFVGYNFSIGDRGLMDANTNIGSNTSTSGAPGSGGDIPTGAGSLVTGGSSALYPYQGSVADNTRGFSAYAMPQQIMAAAAVLLRPPPFELERFTIDLSGYLLNETDFNRLILSTR
jgi:hypothetical protein